MGGGREGRGRHQDHVVKGTLSQDWGGGGDGGGGRRHEPEGKFTKQFGREPEYWR